jgi:hypothetical protein
MWSTSIRRRRKRGQKWDDHDDWVERIGNLTPLAAPINAALQNSEFKKKNPEYKKSDLLVTRQVADFDAWSWRTIERRHAKLAKLAPAIWPYPS